MPARSMCSRPALLALLCLCALAVSACREPHPVSPDLAVAPLAMKWTRNAGLPLNQARSGLPLVLSPGDRRLIAFGGTPTTITETWVFSLKDDAWTTLIMGTAAPPGRSGHCAAYLPPQNQVLYVGGHADGSMMAMAPTVLAAGTPSFVGVTGSAPKPAEGCAAAYLAKASRAVVFGGKNGAALSDETWLFDGTTQTLTRATPADAPSARSGAALVVDPGPAGELASGRLLLFGGATGDAETAELWRFDGDSWAQLGTSSDPKAMATDDPRPLGRQGAAVAVDPNRRLLYVFGGERQGILLGDLWRLDLATLTWERLDLGDGPGGRSEAASAYDPILDRLLLFGGRGDAGPLSDGWTLSPAT